MTKKLTIIIVAAIVLALIAVILIRLWSSSSSAGGGVASGTGDASMPMAGTPPGFVAPTGTTIQIGTFAGTVAVKNFYENVIGYEDQFVILASTTEYMITYDTTNSSFYVQLSSTGVRSVAERALVSVLGMNNTDACKLDIHEGWPGSPTTAAAQPKLSFCP